MASNGSHSKTPYLAWKTRLCRRRGSIELSLERSRIRSLKSTEEFYEITEVENCCVHRIDNSMLSTLAKFGLLWCDTLSRTALVIVRICTLEFKCCALSALCKKRFFALALPQRASVKCEAGPKNWTMFLLCQCLSDFERDWIYHRECQFYHLVG